MLWLHSYSALPTHDWPCLRVLTILSAGDWLLWGADLRRTQTRLGFGPESAGEGARTSTVGSRMWGKWPSHKCDALCMHTVSGVLSLFDTDQTTDYNSVSCGWLPCMVCIFWYSSRNRSWQRTRQSSHETSRLLSTKRSKENGTVVWAFDHRYLQQIWAITTKCWRHAQICPEQWGWHLCRIGLDNVNCVWLCILLFVHVELRRKQV